MMLLDFELKPSRYALYWHAIILSAILLVGWFSLVFWAWCLLFILAVVSYLLWRNQTYVTRLAQLDGALWSIASRSGVIRHLSATNLQHQNTDKQNHSKQQDNFKQKTKPYKNSSITKSEPQAITNSTLHQDKLLQVLDHAVYVVLRFEHWPNVVIWPDQVSTTQWKQLKVLAKMY